MSTQTKGIRTAAREQILREAQNLAKQRQKPLAELMQHPDRVVRELLSRASQAGAMHALEKAASKAT
ncbi:MAG: hypothetical protein Athens041674_175 [Parcubacteria group bacterium Athens0416_74]|nr:MAG: hypothetical protein Athens041674_175 [Parcubacteria group bacterium Athens0416_74]